jgi:hypothetical protein
MAHRVHDKAKVVAEADALAAARAEHDRRVAAAAASARSRAANRQAAARRAAASAAGLVVASGPRWESAAAPETALVPLAHLAAHLAGGGVAAAAAASVLSGFAAEAAAAASNNGTAAVAPAAAKRAAAPAGLEPPPPPPHAGAYAGLPAAGPELGDGRAGLDRATCPAVAAFSLGRVWRVAHGWDELRRRAEDVPLWRAKLAAAGQRAAAALRHEVRDSATNAASTPPSTLTHPSPLTPLSLCVFFFSRVAHTWVQLSSLKRPSLAWQVAGWWPLPLASPSSEAPAEASGARRLNVSRAAVGGPTASSDGSSRGAEGGRGTAARR